MSRTIRIGRRTKRGLTATAVTATLAAVSVIGAGVVPANAADDKGPTYGGAVRSYGAFAAADVLFGFVSARANISESVAVADTNGLSKYGGTGTGNYGVPWNVTRDGMARSSPRWARSCSCPRARRRRSAVTVAFVSGRSCWRPVTAIG